MRITRVSLIIHLLLFFSFESISSTENSDTLKNVVELAYSNNLLLKEKEAQIYALNGRKKEAEALLFNNPEITSSKGWRRPISNSIETEKKTEWGIGVSQKIELTGKQRVRDAVAEAEILSLQAGYTDLKNQVRMEASILYYKILYIKEKIKLDQRTLSLFNQAEKIVNLRKNSGEDTLLDINIAQVETQLANNDLLNSQYTI